MHLRGPAVRAASDAPREPHRVDVRFRPCVAVCSCGWRFQPAPDSGDARQEAWSAAAAHRDELYMAPRRLTAANLSRSNAHLKTAVSFKSPRKRGPGGGRTPRGPADTCKEVATMTEGTRQSRGSGGPVEAAPAHWRELYADFEPDQLGELRVAVALELRGRGLAPNSARDYSATLMRAERFCRERGATVLTAMPEVLGRFADTLTPDKRAQAASALRHYFEVLGRSNPRVPALRVAGRQPGRSRARTDGHRLGVPHSGHAWERTDNAGAARVSETRERMLRDGMSETTIRHYSSMLWRAECSAEMRGLALVELDARTLAEYAETLSGASRRSFRSALRAYYAALGVDDGPIGAVRPPRKPPLVPKPLELEEAQRLLAAAVDEGGRRGIATMFALLLGLRRFEIANLRFADFSNGGVRFVGKCRRDATLPVPELLKSAVDRLPHDSPFLFPGQSGGHVHPTTVWLWVRKLAKAAGLGDVPTHRLRHTCLTVANDKTGDLRAVQEFARHADPETTAGYTRVTQERLSSIGQAVLAALERPGDPAVRAPRAAVVSCSRL